MGCARRALSLFSFFFSPLSPPLSFSLPSAPASCFVHVSRAVLRAYSWFVLNKKVDDFFSSWRLITFDDESKESPSMPLNVPDLCPAFSQASIIKSKSISCMNGMLNVQNMRLSNISSWSPVLSSVLVRFI